MGMQLQSVTAVTIPGYRIYEYLLVLTPHEELQKKIVRVKKEFYEKYKIPKITGNRPSLALVNFLQYEMMEERLLHRLQVVAMSFHPVKIELKNYGSFPCHTIFINVASRITFQSLVKEIRTETQRLMKLNDDNKPHFILEPHFTIASKLLPWQYEKGWLEYCKKHFTGRFMADAMLLLKRPAASTPQNQVKYQAVRKFGFQHMPVTTRQGDLFI